MKATRVSMNRSLLQGMGALAVGTVLAACSGSNDGNGAAAASSPEGSLDASAASPSDPKDPRVEAWRSVLFDSPPSRQGCFHTDYPSTTWIEEPCVPAPAQPVMPRRLPLDEARGDQAAPGSVGNGTDFFLQSPSIIESATGYFPSVTGATSAISTQPDGSTIPGGYSIQMNSNAFTVPSGNSLCPKGGCAAWQQVLYSNIAAQTGVYFQYWLFGYGSCPNSNWTQPPGTTNCFTNSPSVPNVPLVPITSLSQIEMIERVGVGADGGGAGSNDAILFTVGTQGHANVYPSVLGLQSSWNQVEFGVFGDLNLDPVNLGSNTTIEATVGVYPTYPHVNCVASAPSGVTGETNNLNEVPNCCVVSGGSITFLESNVLGQTCTLCGAQGQSCCAVGTACNSSFDYCDTNTNTCEETSLCNPPCENGYVCSGGACVVNHRCPPGYKYCASEAKCIAQAGYCPP